MTRCGGVEMSAEGGAAMERGKGGDNASWIDVNLTGPKNKKKIHAIDSAASNGHRRFKTMMN
jgi:hypothetical protein